MLREGNHHYLSQRSAGRKLQSACSNCHVADANGGLGGPDIFDGKVCIFDQAAATSDANFDYSDALRDSGLTWTEETLDEWLKNPQHLVNGTAMAFQGLSNEEERAEVIASLKEACGMEADGTGDDSTTSGAKWASSSNLALIATGMLGVVLGRK